MNDEIDNLIASFGQGKPLEAVTTVTEAPIVSVKPAFTDDFNPRDPLSKSLRTLAMEEVVRTAIALRQAQKAYMADRGNNALGKAVGQTGVDVDKALVKFHTINQLKKS